MNLSPVANRMHTLLIISSDHANLQLMTQLIASRDDLRLLTARSGSDGLELAETAQPEVVVMDTTLSDSCATEVLKRLRANHFTSHIPIIAVSSDAQSAQIQAGLQAGFHRYLTKPYLLGDLLDAIDCSLRYNFGKSEGVGTRHNKQLLKPDIQCTSANLQ